MIATSPRPIPRDCPQLGHEVAPAAIDKELRKLWEQDEARTNASLINLVVYSEEHGALLENSEIIRNLTREHACRAILVEIDRDDAVPSIRSWVTAHCHLAHGLKSVCCEQIAIFLTGKVTGRFRNTVFAHLNADLPLVFWWQGELSDILTERLVTALDRLIVDSSGWSDPNAAFDRIEAASGNNPSLILHDLAWSRSWQFRLGVAAIFDHPAALNSIDQIDTIEIDYHPAHFNSALLLLAWLATQAGWQDAPAAAPAFVSRQGTPIEVRLNASPAGPPLGRLLLRAGEKSASITQAPGAPHVRRCIHAPGYEACSLAPTDPEAAEDLIGVLLARGGKNSLFRKVLPRFRHLLEAASHRNDPPVN